MYFVKTFDDEIWIHTRGSLPPGRDDNERAAESDLQAESRQSQNKLLHDSTNARTSFLDGEEMSMAFCPPLLQKHPRVVQAPAVSLISACWRGYQGTWEIRENRFYLAGLSGGLQLRPGEPIFADWFSGVLRVPKGKRLISDVTVGEHPAESSGRGWFVGSARLHFLLHTVRGSG
jgi:hypothetical protein